MISPYHNSPKQLSMKQSANMGHKTKNKKYKKTKEERQNDEARKATNKKISNFILT
jgi:hypothetical protein